MAKSELDLGIDLDHDSKPEVTVYDDRLAYITVIGALVIYGLSRVKN